MLYCHHPFNILTQFLSSLSHLLWTAWLILGLNVFLINSGGESASWWSQNLKMSNHKNQKLADRQRNGAVVQHNIRERSRAEHHTGTMAAFFHSSGSSVTLEIGVCQDFPKNEPKVVPVETVHKPSRYLETWETGTFFTGFNLDLSPS